jgi:hypothetical protein
MDLIRELLLRLEALPTRRGGIVHIPPDAGEIAMPGYDVVQIKITSRKSAKPGSSMKAESGRRRGLDSAA